MWEEYADLAQKDPFAEAKAVIARLRDENEKLRSRATDLETELNDFHRAAQRIVDAYNILCNAKTDARGLMNWRNNVMLPAILSIPNAEPTNFNR